MVILLATIQLSNTLCFLLGVLVLGLWLGQIRVRPTSRRGLLIGLLLAGMFLTRSFDAVALGLVLIVAQFWVAGVRSSASWRWAAAVCVGGLPGGVGLLASHHATTGDWKESPYLIYERQQSYKGQFLQEALEPPPNFGNLPVNVRRIAEEFVAPAHRAHTLAHLPVAIGERLAELSRELGHAMLLLPLVALPVLWRCRAVRPVAGLCLGYFGFYLLYAFNSPRYMAPILAGLAWAMLAGLDSVRPRRWATLLQILLVLLLATGAFITVNTLIALPLDRETKDFHDAMAPLPAGRKLIFIRYAPDHDFNREFVYNQPDLDRAERILAHDLGDERNAELIAAYGDRAAFLYDEAAGEMRPYPPVGGENGE
ncbi:MAG: hypothetical protein V3S01_00570 [Dehalococcoidia bacterium]